MITLNAVAAAHAVNDFLFDFLDLRPKTMEAAYQHYHFLKDVAARVVPRRDPGCRECGGRFGMADAIELPTISG